jgi:hypothetical protein
VNYLEAVLGNVFAFWIHNIAGQSWLIAALRKTHSLPDFADFDSFVLWLKRHGANKNQDANRLSQADALWADYSKWCRARLAPLPKRLPRELVAA